VFCTITTAGYIVTVTKH